MAMERKEQGGNSQRSKRTIITSLAALGGIVLASSLVCSANEIGSSVIWDYVAVYEPGSVWGQAPPEPAFSDVPVVRAIDGTREALRRLLGAQVK